MGPLVYTSGRPAGVVSISPTGLSLQWGRWFTPAVGRNGRGLHVLGTSGFNGAAGLHQR